MKTFQKCRGREKLKNKSVPSPSSPTYFSFQFRLPFPRHAAERHFIQLIHWSELTRGQLGFGRGRNHVTLSRTQNLLKNGRFYASRVFLFLFFFEKQKKKSKSFPFPFSRFLVFFFSFSTEPTGKPSYLF